MALPVNIYKGLESIKELPNSVITIIGEYFFEEDKIISALSHIIIREKITKKHIEDLECILRNVNGLYLNSINNFGSTALVSAVSKGHVKVVELLLERRANPNAKDFLDNTPLHLAAFKADVQLKNLLLEYNADPNILNGSGKTVGDIEKERSKKRLLKFSKIKNKRIKKR